MRKTENYREFPLIALQGTVQIEACLAEIEATAVEIARQKGASWEAIADAMAVTRQAVYSRFRNGTSEAVSRRQRRR